MYFLLEDKTHASYCKAIEILKLDWPDFDSETFMAILKNQNILPSGKILY